LENDHKQDVNNVQLLLCSLIMAFEGRD